MSRIHPANAGDDGARQAAAAEQPAVYTVWKRSSMGFQGTDGFSVYDNAGSLAFRVDNYSRRRKAFTGELLLMDGQGSPLLSLRPQILSLHNRWNCYSSAEEGLDNTIWSSSVSSSSQKPIFSMSKCSPLQSSDEAEVYMAATASRHNCHRAHDHPPSFKIDGCFSKRSCKIIHGGNGEEVARITRKKVSMATARPVTLGDDVFSLVVQPGVDAATIMAIVVVMDRICRKPYTPSVCSSQACTSSVVHSSGDTKRRSVCKPQ